MEMVELSVKVQKSWCDSYKLSIGVYVYSISYSPMVNIAMFHMQGHTHRKQSICQQPNDYKLID